MKKCSQLLGKIQLLGKMYHNKVLVKLLQFSKPGKVVMVKCHKALISLRGCGSKGSCSAILCSQVWQPEIPIFFMDRSSDGLHHPLSISFYKDPASCLLHFPIPASLWVATWNSVLVGWFSICHLSILFPFSLYDANRAHVSDVLFSFSGNLSSVAVPEQRRGTNWI